MSKCQKIIPVISNKDTAGISKNYLQKVQDPKVLLLDTILKRSCREPSKMQNYEIILRENERCREADRFL